MSHDPSARTVRCPVCSALGVACAGPTRVPEITLASLVRPEHHAGLPAGSVYFCPQPECDAVYFDLEGHVVHKAQLAVRVWQKERDLDVPVCYCFGHTARAIVEDARRHPRPTIPDGIREKIRAGLCECDRKNPRGTCCLGDVAWWIKKGLAPA
jgi:hypothetical protein